MNAATPENEAERLDALRRYQILDTPPDGAFDRIAEMATA
jgi:sigma-B regulation protein RsbU (phosphoserine phosphatase)